MSKRGIDSEVAKLESNTMTIEILKNIPIVVIASFGLL